MILHSIKRKLIYFLVNHVLAGTRYFAWKRHLLNSAGHSLGEGTKVVGPLFCTGTLTAGKNCWIGANFTLHGNGTVQLGDQCDIGPDVTFLTGGHKTGTSRQRAGEGQTYNIQVEDGCWIGARATLGKQITIGKGCIVAACACVTQNVPENTLVGGVPAKEIRKLDDN